MDDVNRGIDTQPELGFVLEAVKDHDCCLEKLSTIDEI